MHRQWHWSSNLSRVNCFTWRRKRTRTHEIPLSETFREIVCYISIDGCLGCVLSKWCLSKCLKFIWHVCTFECGSVRIRRMIRTEWFNKNRNWNEKEQEQQHDTKQTCPLKIAMSILFLKRTRCREKHSSSITTNSSNKITLLTNKHVEHYCNYCPCHLSLSLKHTPEKSEKEMKHRCDFSFDGISMRLQLTNMCT